MAIKLAVGGLVVVLLLIFLKGTIFGGGGSKSLADVAKSGAIPTATPPVTLPEPILLGQASASGPGSSTGSSSSSNAPSTYTVKAGDTLGAIASANNVPADQQAAWNTEVLRLNGIDDPRLLKAGQELQLPKLPTAVPTRTTPVSGTPGTPRPGTTTTPSRTGTVTSGGGTAPSPTRAAGSNGNTYTVQSGDTPLAIAIKLGIPSAQQTDWVSQLISINQANPNNLNIGQVLQLPSTTSGGSLSGTPVPTATKTN